MFRSLSSGEVIDRKWTRFSFPTTWHYDVLRGLDYLRAAGVEPDERVAEAVELVAKRRHQNGRWPLNKLHPDPVRFDMEGARAQPAAGSRCAPHGCWTGIRHATTHRSPHDGSSRILWLPSAWGGGPRRADYRLRLPFPRGVKPTCCGSGEPPIGIWFVAGGHARLVLLGKDPSDEFSTAANADLVEDGLEVIAHRVGGDVQLLGDFGG